MKNITLTKETAQNMKESGIESLIQLAKENYPEIFIEEKQWEDFGVVKGYYVNTESIIGSANTIANKFNRNIHPTKKDAESALALAQILQWRDKANGESFDWCDWSYSAQTKYTIVRDGGVVVKDFAFKMYNPLAFKTTEIRDNFLRDHKTLLNIYFQC